MELPADLKARDPPRCAQEAAGAKEGRAERAKAAQPVCTPQFVDEVWPCKQRMAAAVPALAPNHGALFTLRCWMAMRASFLCKLRGALQAPRPAGELSALCSPALSNGNPKVEERNSTPRLLASGAEQRTVPGCISSHGVKGPTAGMRPCSWGQSWGTGKGSKEKEKRAKRSRDATCGG